MYRGADKSLARPRRKQANVSVRMTWTSFGAFPCKKKKTWWQLASPCCWNRARPWHASELVSLMVGLRIYQHPRIYMLTCRVYKSLIFTIKDCSFALYVKLFNQAVRLCYWSLDWRAADGSVVSSTVCQSRSAFTEVHRSNTTVDTDLEVCHPRCVCVKTGKGM